jgi:hypothetical protein
VRVWQWGLDIRTVLHAALSTLEWLQRQDLIDADLFPSSSASGQESEQKVEKETVNDREGENSDIFREHYNHHSQWIQRVRKICATTISTNASRSNGGKDLKSLLQLLSPLYLEHKVLGPELKVLGTSDERDKAKERRENTGVGSNGSSGGGGRGSGEESIEADWSEALSGELRAVQDYWAVQHSTVLVSAVRSHAAQYSTVQYSAVQYSTEQCSTVQYSTVQCSTVRSNAVQCSTVQCSAVQYGAMQYSAVQCSTVQCSAVQCRAVQYSTVKCSEVKCSAVQCSAV